jgi:hypothetical protein
MTDTITVEIPTEVRDNSETVVDYAHMGHRAPDKGVRTPLQRETDVSNAAFFGYKVYTWRDVNPDGQRCAFTMIVKEDGAVRHLFHTEYFTRVACAEGDWCHSYATHYVHVAYVSGEPSDGPSPLCDEHRRRIERAYGENVTLTLSERLIIGQHD